MQVCRDAAKLRGKNEEAPSKQNVTALQECFDITNNPLYTCDYVSLSTFWQVRVAQSSNASRFACWPALAALFLRSLHHAGGCACCCTAQLPSILLLAVPSMLSDRDAAICCAQGRVPAALLAADPTLDPAVWLSHHTVRGFCCNLEPWSCCLWPGRMPAYLLSL